MDRRGAGDNAKNKGDMMGRRRVGITPELLQEWFTEGNKVTGVECIEGLPEDARYIGSGTEAGHVYLIFEHSDWPEDVILLDQNIPMIEIRFKHKYDQDRVLEYEDRGIKRKVAFLQSGTTTDWPCDGTVLSGVLIVQPLPYPVEELT